MRSHFQNESKENLLKSTSSYQRKFNRQEEDCIPLAIIWENIIPLQTARTSLRSPLAAAQSWCG